MFPGAGAQVFRNEEGEVLGWDSGAYEPEPFDEYADWYDREPEEDEPEDAEPEEDDAPFE